MTYAKEIKANFTDLNVCQLNLYVKFSNHDFIRNIITPYDIFSYAGYFYGRVGGSVEYDEVIRCMSQMLKYFEVFFLKKDLAFKPFIETSMVHQIDPIYRQRVRLVN